MKIWFRWFFPKCGGRYLKLALILVAVVCLVTLPPDAAHPEESSPAPFSFQSALPAADVAGVVWRLTQHAESQLW